MQGKFQNIVWAVNGVLLFFAFLYYGYKEWNYSYAPYDYEYQTPQLILGEKLEEAKKKGLALQGIEYDELIYLKKTDSYALPILIKTYEVPVKITQEAFESAGDISPSISEYYSRVNVLFLDKNLENPKILLDRKGFIEMMKYPQINDQYRSEFFLDEKINHIAYTIGFEDSNHDRLLNEDDDSDLYLSDLQGNDLFQVTKNVYVKTYEFMNENELLLKYYKREDKGKENSRLFFARYLIKERKLVELTSMQESLDVVEKLIIK